VTNLSIRWLQTSNNAINGTLASAGTNRIDDIVVSGKKPSIVLTPISDSPFTVTEGISKEITGLQSETEYFYTVTAKAGAFTSDQSNEISATTTTPTINNDNALIPSFRVSAANGVLSVEGAVVGERIEVYSAIGRLLASQTAVKGINRLDISLRGVVLVKAGDKLQKTLIQ
jgi:hypothetical protein